MARSIQSAYVETLEYAGARVTFPRTGASEVLVFGWG